MRRQLSLVLGLALALVLAPVVPAFADDTAAPASPTAEASTPPALPTDTGAVDAKDVPATVTGTAKPDVPTDVLVKPGEAKPEGKPSRFKAGNFLLGFLGGALLGGAYAVLSSGNMSDSQKSANLVLYGGGGALALGVAGLFLGATTPEEAKPPKVEGRAPFFPGVQVALRF